MDHQIVGDKRNQKSFFKDKTLGSTQIICLQFYGHSPGAGGLHTEIAGQISKDNDEKNPESRLCGVK